jgi:hypothetical protein
MFAHGTPGTLNNDFHSFFRYACASLLLASLGVHRWLPPVEHPPNFVLFSRQRVARESERK